MTKVIFGGHLTANINDYVSLRLAANYGSISGDDAVINGKGGLEEARLVRNLNFKSTIKEAFLVAELYPFVYFEEDPSDTWHKLRPYGVIGAGVFHFNPQGKVPGTNNWVYLKPLRTEGQGFVAGRNDYKLTQVNIPMGIGVKYFASDNMNISFEIIHRATFTDYIDDVSTTYIDPSLFYANMPAATANLAVKMYDKRAGTGTRVVGKKRGTATNNDGYYSAGFKFSFRIGGDGDRSFRNSTRCPVMRF
jgi:hypothetical protein